MEIKRRELQSSRGERHAQRASAHVTCKRSGDLLAGWHCGRCGTLCPERTGQGVSEKGGPPWFGRVSWGSPRTSQEKEQPRWREKQRRTLGDKRTYHMAWSLIRLKKSWTVGDTGATTAFCISPSSSEETAVDVRFFSVWGRVAQRFWSVHPVLVVASAPVPSMV